MPLQPSPHQIRDLAARKLDGLTCDQSAHLVAGNFHDLLVAVAKAVLQLQPAVFAVVVAERTAAILHRPVLGEALFIGVQIEVQRALQGNAFARHPPPARVGLRVACAQGIRITVDVRARAPQSVLQPADRGGFTRLKVVGIETAAHRPTLDQQCGTRAVGRHAGEVRGQIELAVGVRREGVAAFQIRTFGKLGIAEPGIGTREAGGRWLVAAANAADQQGRQRHQRQHALQVSRSPCSNHQRPHPDGSPGKTAGAQCDCGGCGRRGPDGERHGPSSSLQRRAHGGAVALRYSKPLPNTRSRSAVGRNHRSAAARASSTKPRSAGT
jgi:hypothetical protein